MVVQHPGFPAGRNEPLRKRPDALWPELRPVDGVPADIRAVLLEAVSRLVPELADLRKQAVSRHPSDLPHVLDLVRIDYTGGDRQRSSDGQMWRSGPEAPGRKTPYPAELGFMAAVHPARMN